MRVIAKSLVALILVAFFVLTWPVNHEETDVGFRNACAVLHGLDGVPLRGDEFAYVWLMRSLYSGIRHVGFRGDVWNLMAGINVACAIATIFLFFKFCYRRFSLRPISSLLSTALFMLSYAFWRNVSMAEAVIPATLAALAAVYWITHPNRSASRVVGGGLLAAIAMVLSALNTGGMLIVIPLYYMLYRRWRAAVAHVGLTLGWLILILSGLHLAGGPPVAAYSIFAGGGRGLAWTSFPDGLLGLGQSWLSGNFLLGFESFRQWIVASFPQRILVEEVFMGQHTSAPEIIAGMAFFLIAIAMAVLSGVMAIRIRRKRLISLEEGSIALKDGSKTLWGVLLWAAVYAANILWLQPENAGVWAFGLAPIWLAFCGLVILPLARTRTFWPVLALVLATGFHNYWGGLRPQMNPRGDYHQAQGDWILNEAKPSDSILVAYRDHFYYWLRLRFEGRVEILDSWSDVAGNWNTMKSKHDRVWILKMNPDLPGYPRAGTVSDPDAPWSPLLPDFKLAHQGPAGSVLVWTRQAAGQ